MKTNLTRVLFCTLLTTIFLASGFVLNAQTQINNSGYRNTPTLVPEQDERVNKLINQADVLFHEGEAQLRDKSYSEARGKFDKSVEVILMSGVSVRAFPKLNAYYAELIDKIYKLEVPNMPSLQQPVKSTDLVATATSQPADALPQIGFSEQKFEASPLDELAKLQLTPEEQNVDTPVAQEQFRYAETAVARGSLGFGFQMTTKVQEFINYYQGRGRSTMEIGLNRSGQFTRMARRIFREEGVPENIVWLGQVESAWKPWARSWAAASGLWQFIPGTGSRYGLRQTAYLDERHNYEKATRASAKYLKFLANRYNGNWELAMAGYNSGEGNVDRAISRAGSANFWAAYPYLPQETRNYVPNILATILIANSPDRYGFGNVRPMPPLFYDRVRVPTATNLSLIAQATDTSVDVLRYLNPDLRQNMTPPEAYILNVPAGKSNQLVAVLRRVPANSRSSAAVATIGRGEDIQSFANRTGATVEQIQAMNNGVDFTKASKIVVPNMIAKTGYVRASGSITPTTQKALTKVTAKEGDTVEKIASRYGFNAVEIARLNGVLPSTPLAAGREIRVQTR
ncbi:MAG: transglycosylase SLT domain-containing protein [Pyrinomonadaceae bacterium]